MVVKFTDRGYRCMPGPLQCARGVAAEPGHEIHRVRFLTARSLDAGFEKIRTWLHERHLPLTALCGCEFRIPDALAGRADDPAVAGHPFNSRYLQVLEQWGIVQDGFNPVARSQVVPELSPPVEPAFYAFSYVEPSAGSRPTFVLAGSSEGAVYSAANEALGDTVNQVMDELEYRMRGLAMSWTDVTAAQIYSIHNTHTLVKRVFASRQIEIPGLKWNLCRSPLAGMEFEMDCRRVINEHVLV